MSSLSYLPPSPPLLRLSYCHISLWYILVREQYLQLYNKGLLLWQGISGIPRFKHDMFIVTFQKHCSDFYLVYVEICWGHSKTEFQTCTSGISLNSQVNWPFINYKVRERGGKFLTSSFFLRLREFFYSKLHFNFYKQIHTSNLCLWPYCLVLWHLEHQSTRNRGFIENGHQYGQKEEQELLLNN